jgi:hypothetical protein
MSSVSPLPAPTEQPVSQPSTAPAQPAPAPARTSASPDQRLVIQETGELGVFVYTILDRTSGRVITQLPCETVLDLARHPDYAAGQVVSTTA